MKLLRFLLYLFRQGTLHTPPVDFQTEREKALAGAGIFSPETEKRGALNSWLMRNPVAYMVAANLAYLKNSFTMNNMYFICDEHRLIYVRILKCASTSMLKVFLPLLDGKLKNGDLSPQLVDSLEPYFRHQVLSISQSSYTKFALVRNPFQRLVSSYLDIFDPESERFTYAAYWFGILRRDMSFKAFVATIEKIPGQLLGPHFSPQASIIGIPEKNDTLIFRIDRDMASLDTFLDQYGLSLPQVNKHPAAYDYRSYYDKQTFDIVRNLYRRDIKAFGYEAESTALGEYVNAL